MKAVLISIQPKWVEKIASGKKTIEVRKSRPKLESPFKCYIYCTKAKEVVDIGKTFSWGKEVIGEFICDKIDKYLCEEYEWGDGDVSLEYRIRTVEGEKTCLEYDEVREYGNEKPLYFWHISNLKIYDKPKKLNEFKKENICYKKGDLDNLGCWERGCVIQEQGWCDGRCSEITTPPQSWGYVLGE